LVKGCVIVPVSMGEVRTGCGVNELRVEFCKMVVALSSSSLCSTGTDHPFVPTCGWRAPRAGAVKAGRRPPPEAARSGLDGVEHGAILGQVGAKDVAAA
jgi:hypothetical protein